MKKFVSLSGGLGNQLFQLAGAVSVYETTDFAVEWSIGITNVNVDGNPEVFDYQIPTSIHLLPKKNPTILQRKLAHLILRRSSSRKVFPGDLATTLISSLLALSLIQYLRTFTRIIFPKNLDANSVESETDQPEFLIGFFHSDVWSRSISIKAILENIEPKVIDPYVAEMRALADLKKPIVVHIRLGDYEKEEKFGILPSRYYEEALDRLSELGFNSEIWIFTNDLVKAVDIFPKKFVSRTKWIPNFSNSSVQVLEAMRLGSAYVIGNSTFSWWAAKLARDKAAKVVAPGPWFKSAPTHLDLLPKNWITINPW
jgi:hypothetical protein